MNDTKHLKYEGIIIKIADVKEDDQILTAYTKNDGKISFYAKGLKKPNSKLKQASELGKICDFEIIKSNDLLILTGINELHPVSYKATDLEFLVVISQITEIIDKLTHYDELTDEGIYQVLKQTLLWLGLGNPWVAGKYFEWHMMSLLGYTGELGYCSECNLAFKRGQWRSVASIFGGFYCKDCMKSQKKNALLFFGEEENGFLRFLENADEYNIGIYYPTNKLIKKMNLYFKKSWEMIFDSPLASYNYLKAIE